MSRLTIYFILAHKYTENTEYLQLYVLKFEFLTQKNHEITF